MNAVMRPLLVASLMVKTAASRLCRPSQMAALYSTLRGVTMMPSASFVMVRNAHPYMYAETMVCGIANSNEVSSVSSSTPYGSMPPRFQPSNTLRSESALTALAGHPTHALTFVRIRSGMLMSKSLNR